MNIKKHILVIGFLVFISFPLVNNFLNILPDIVNNENRKLRSFPKLDTCKIEEVNEAIENYLIDNISIRNRMIKFYNHLNIFIYKSSPVSIKAIVGKNGWYFMTGEEIKTYVGTSLFTKEQLIAFKNEMIRRKKIVEENNGHFFFVIVPNKSNIYPEYLPNHIIKTNDAGYGKQLLNYLKENNVPVIDLYSPLLRAKKESELYFRTDNHWNDYGAFIASNEILKTIHKFNSNVNELDRKVYKSVAAIEKPGNIAKMFSIENEITEMNYKPTRQNGFISALKKQNKYKPTEGFPYPEDYENTRYTNNDSLPTILIIRDSFGKNLFPYISEQCKKCVAIYDGWHYALNEPIIKEERPNFVLLMVVESNLKDVMKHKNDK